MSHFNVIEKIKNLRNLATSANAYEAAAAAKVADKLIAQHRISEAEIQASSKVDLPAAIKADNPLYETARVTSWKNNLASYLTAHYGCKMINDFTYTAESRNRISRYYIIGNKGDTEIVRFMFTWLSNEIERLCKKHCKGKGRVVCASYCEGAVDGINVQLALSKEEIKREAINTGTSSALAILDNRLELASMAMYKIYPNLRTERKSSHRQIDINAFNKGKADGLNIHLGKSLKE